MSRGKTFDYFIVSFSYFDLGRRISYYKFKNSSAGYIMTYSGESKYWVIQCSDLSNDYEAFFKIVNSVDLFEYLDPRDKMSYMFHADEFDDIRFVYSKNLGIGKITYE